MYRSFWFESFWLWLFALVIGAMCKGTLSGGSNNAKRTAQKTAAKIAALPTHVLVRDFFRRAKSTYRLKKKVAKTDILVKIRDEDPGNLEDEIAMGHGAF